MPKPTPEPTKPEEVLDVSLAVVKGDRAPMLASINGDHPRVRPISPLRTVGFTIYFASLRNYHKTGELEANPNVEMCFIGNGHDQVRLTGVCKLITDKETRQDIWDSSPLLRYYLDSVDNPVLLMYRVDPTRVRFMREWALDYHEVPFEGIAAGKV
jgi:general stress protein 26